jgi:hypothetical protein
MRMVLVLMAKEEAGMALVVREGLKVAVSHREGEGGGGEERGGSQTVVVVMRLVVVVMRAWGEEGGGAGSGSRAVVGRGWKRMGREKRRS